RGPRGRGGPGPGQSAAADPVRPDRDRGRPLAAPSPRTRPEQVMKVLLDATAIPADRGGVGRYVDALLPRLAALGVELAVVCQARDVEVTSALVPAAEVVAAPPTAAGRPV